MYFVLTDVSDMMQITVLPNLADHCFVCIDINVHIGERKLLYAMFGIFVALTDMV